MQLYRLLREDYESIPDYHGKILLWVAYGAKVAEFQHHAPHMGLR